MNSIPVSILEADEVWELIKGKTISGVEVDPHGDSIDLLFEDFSRLVILPNYGEMEEGIDILLEQPDDEHAGHRYLLNLLVMDKKHVRVFQVGESERVGYGRLFWNRGWYCALHSSGPKALTYFRLEDVRKVQYRDEGQNNHGSITLSEDYDPTKGGW